MVSSLAAVLDACWDARAYAVSTGDTNSAGGPSCGYTTEVASCALVGVEQTWGAYRTATGAPEHVWLTLPDGTIVDPTADQFGEVPILVLPPGAPGRDRYLLGVEGDDRS